MSRLHLHEAGWLTPYALHACYAGLAESLSEDDTPWLISARADRGHIALGASQYADAELNLAYCRMRRIPIVQRSLGGGTVWVDRRQLCLFFIFPRTSAPASHAALFDLCLGLLKDAYARIGVEVERVGGQDLWHAGRKLLGSGAATIGRSMVFGASILERFDAASFAACVDCPSRGFERWLGDCLSESVTDLEAAGMLPYEGAFEEALRAVCGSRWAVTTQRPEAHRLAAMSAAELALREPLEMGGRRLVRGGIKIKRGTYLLEDTTGPWLRLLWRDGRLVRAASGDKDFDAVLQACLACPLDDGIIYEQGRLHGLSLESARTLAQRVEALCAGLEPQECASRTA